MYDVDIRELETKAGRAELRASKPEREGDWLQLRLHNQTATVYKKINPSQKEDR